MKYRQPPDSRDHDQNRDHFYVRDVVASYNAKAPTLVRDYDDLLFEQVHAPVFGMEIRLTPEAVFKGLMVQQMELKRDQQLAVWRPPST